MLSTGPNDIYTYSTNQKDGKNKNIIKYYASIPSTIG